MSRLLRKIQFYIVLDLVAAGHKFDSSLVMKRTHDKWRPAASDAHVCFWYDLYIFYPQVLSENKWLPPTLSKLKLYFWVTTSKPALISNSVFSYWRNLQFSVNVTVKIHVYTTRKWLWLNSSDKLVYATEFCILSTQSSPTNKHNNHI
jgi:hypothetical protein